MTVVPPLVSHGSGKEITPQMYLDFKTPITKSQGINLPHWDQEYKLQFVTFRLGDSIPKGKLAELEEKKIAIIESDTNMDCNKYLFKINYWLQQGIGSCLLQYDEVQAVVDKAIKYYDGIRYDLYDYVIMPNHVHMIVMPYTPFRKTFIDFARYTTREIKRLLGIVGRIWSKDCFSRIIRNNIEINEYIEYIKNNPNDLVTK